MGNDVKKNEAEAKLTGALIEALTKALVKRIDPEEFPEPNWEEIIPQTEESLKTDPVAFRAKLAKAVWNPEGRNCPLPWQPVVQRAKDTGKFRLCAIVSHAHPSDGLVQLEVKQVAVLPASTDWSVLPYTEAI